MMSPTVVLRDGELEAGLGSGGSNRIRSAILQTIVRLVADGLDVAEAVVAPAGALRGGRVQAEPGIDEAALERLEARGYEVVRWPQRNVFFGGVHAVTRDPATASSAGRGRPAPRRRGGGGVAARRPQPTTTLPFSFARSAISRERVTASTSASSAPASTRMRSGSVRSSSRCCLVSGGSSTRAAIP